MDAEVPYGYIFMRAGVAKRGNVYIMCQNSAFHHITYDKKWPALLRRFPSGHCL